MPEVITPDLLRRIIEDFAVVMQENADYLTQLDRAIGDGDHGWNMAVGFQRICDQLDNLTSASLALLLRTCGMTLVNTVSGASGPLYGAAFIAAGMEANGLAEITLPDLARLTKAAADAIARRGRCRLGDKTIYDAFQPAAEALQKAARRKSALSVGLDAAARAAYQGMLATTPLVARRGLAMQFGAASVGHQDPGATSCYLLFDSLRRTCS